MLCNTGFFLFCNDFNEKISKCYIVFSAKPKITCLVVHKT